MDGPFEIFAFSAIWGRACKPLKSEILKQILTIPRFNKKNLFTLIGISYEGKENAYL